MFCIAFLVRTYIGTPILKFLAPRIIGNRVHGAAREAANVVLGVCVNTPVTGAITALLFTDIDDFLNTYLMALSTTMPLTILVSYFLVGPAVKMLFNNRIKPADGLKIMRVMSDNASSILRLFGM